MHVLTGQEVADLLSPAACVAAVERAFRLLGEGTITPPQAMGVHVPGGGFHMKAGVLPSAGRLYFAAKLNGNFPDNPEAYGLPTIQGVVMLSDAENGRMLAVMDSVVITALRTAAATAVAARWLARQDSSVVALCGCGVQARAHLDALMHVLPVRRVLLHDRVPGRAAAFAAASNDAVSFTIAGSVAEAVALASVVVTCTTSTEFILRSGDVSAGCFVAGVGVDDERKRELHPDLLASSTVVTDQASQCARIGDLHHAIESGAMRAADVHADLGDIVAGRAAGRTSPEEIIVFDSTGLGLQDVAAAVAVYEHSGGAF